METGDGSRMTGDGSRITLVIIIVLLLIILFVALQSNNFLIRQDTTVEGPESTWTEQVWKKTHSSVVTLPYPGLTGTMISPNGMILICAHGIVKWPDWVENGNPTQEDLNTAAEKRPIVVFSHHMGKLFKGHIIRVLAKADIALIKIDVKDHPYLEIDSGPINVGQPIANIGSPGIVTSITNSDKIYRSREQRTFDTGVIRDTNFCKEIQNTYVSTILVSSSAYKGASGGPLLTEEGKIIGVLSHLTNVNSVSTSVLPELLPVYSDVRFLPKLLSQILDDNHPRVIGDHFLPNTTLLTLKDKYYDGDYQLYLDSAINGENLDIPFNGMIVEDNYARFGIQSILEKGQVLEAIDDVEIGLEDDRLGDISTLMYSGDINRDFTIKYRNKFTDTESKIKTVKLSLLPIGLDIDHSSV